MMTLGPMFFCSVLYLPFYVSSWLWAPCFSVLFCIYHFMYHDDLGSMVFCSVLYLPFYVSSWLWAPCFSVLFCIYHFMYHHDFGPHVFLFCSVFTILCIMMSLGPMFFCSILYLPFYVSSWLWAPCFSVLFCIYHFMYHDDFGSHVFLCKEELHGTEVEHDECEAVHHPTPGEGWCEEVEAQHNTDDEHAVHHQVEAVPHVGKPVLYLVLDRSLVSDEDLSLKELKKKGNTLFFK